MSSSSCSLECDWMPGGYDERAWFLITRFLFQRPAWTLRLPTPSHFLFNNVSWFLSCFAYSSSPVKAGLCVLLVGFWTAQLLNRWMSFVDIGSFFYVWMLPTSTRRGRLYSELCLIFFDDVNAILSFIFPLRIPILLMFKSPLWMLPWSLKTFLRHPSPFLCPMQCLTLN